MKNNLQNDQNEGTPFYLAPAQSIYGVIDYRKVEGRKLFEKSIAKLEVDQFDGKAGDLHLFLDSLQERAQEMGLELQGVGAMEIALDPINPDSDVVNIITNHGRVKLEQIQ